MAFAPRQTKKGVTAKAWGKRKLYRHAFMAQMKSGHMGIYRREGRERLPIKEMYGPSVPREMATNEIVNEMHDTFEERVIARLPANVRYYVAQCMKRRGR